MINKYFCNPILSGEKKRKLIHQHSLQKNKRIKMNINTNEKTLSKKHNISFNHFTPTNLLITDF
jgi:hypothetical protein